MLFKILFSSDGDIYVVIYEHGYWYKPICILTAGDVEDLHDLVRLAEDEIGGNYAKDV